MAQKSGGLTESVRNNKTQTKNRIYKMINFILSFFLITTSADAGSICNDGTYSYSEGRGTCSWHGGVAVSGVYHNYSSPIMWVDDYHITDSGIPSYLTGYGQKGDFIVYSCFPIEGGIPGEKITFFVSPFNIKNHTYYELASIEGIKVFAHTGSGYKVISGNWQWRSDEGALIISKLNHVMESLAEPLSKNDMSNIILSDHFVVSVEDLEDVIIKTPGIARKVTDTWNKCNASSNK
jgi:hypothetical protein